MTQQLQTHRLLPGLLSGLVDNLQASCLTHRAGQGGWEEPVGPVVMLGWERPGSHGQRQGNCSRASQATFLLIVLGRNKRNL